MSTVIVTAVPWLPAPRVLELLVDENIGALPVVDENGCPLGIVTRADVLEEEEEPAVDGEEVTAEVLMRRSPITVEPTTTISDAARMMARQRVHHLLVVDAAGRLVGLLSSFDVVRWVAALQGLYLTR